MQGRYAKAYLIFLTHKLKGMGGLFDTLYIVSAKSELDAEDDSLKGESTRARESDFRFSTLPSNSCVPGRLNFPLLFFLLVGDAFALSKHITKPTALTLCTL